jgi:ABC-type oligopeptide transport system substrate-binding subunit
MLGHSLGWHKFGALALFLIAFPLVFAVIQTRSREKRMEKPDATIYFVTPPYSTDPQDYDAFVHHILQRPVFSSIVSQYRSGEFVGTLANAWHASNDFKTWTFEVRNDVKFSNGDVVTAAAIKSSWTRTAYLMKQKESHSGVFEHVIGYENLSSPSSEFSGVVVSGETIEVRLTQPMPKFLEAISFGLYGITHINDFDSVSGMWLANKQPISSGPYIIESWTNDFVTLKSRADYPAELRHPNPISTVKLVWKTELRDSSDIIVSEDIDAALPHELQFFGPNKSGIRYLRVIPWKSPTHPLANKL